jgi:hypothetical protein
MALNVELLEVQEFRSAMEEWTTRLGRDETEGRK